MGSPTGREPYGDGALIVVVGLTPHQGERESRSQGEARQVADVQKGEVREMRDAATILDIIRARSERGLPLEDVYRIICINALSSTHIRCCLKTA